MPRPATFLSCFVLTCAACCVRVPVDLCPGESPLPAKQLTNQLQELLPSRANALVTAVAGGACTSAPPIPFAVAAARPLTMHQVALMKALQAQGITYASGTAQF